MPNLGRVLWFFLLTFLLADSSYAQDDHEKCPYAKGRTIEDLEASLAAHKGWLDREDWDQPDVPGRADFCNANLTEAHLQGADLRWADLRGTDLRSTNLQGARLSRATLQGADLSQADLREANLVGASLPGVRLSQVNLQEAVLSRADLAGADLIQANLQGATLSEAQLQGADLRDARLQGADLRVANLQGAILTGAQLQGANLYRANLQSANLANAGLQETRLLQANLREADLSWAILREAEIARTVLTDAVLYGADLSAALYQPATAPAIGGLSDLRGLESVWYCPGEESGLVQLREALKQAGLRDPERVATKTLESIRTRYALAGWQGLTIEHRLCRDAERNRIAVLEGVFRLIFFEWTTDYGLAYGRPILILFAMIGIFALIYLPALLVSPKSPVDSGIFRIWPEGRIEQEAAKPAVARDVIVERLRSRNLSALGLAFHFSVISAFHLGWRDLNVGTWIARLQPSEYALRAKGWVRVISGVQSLISVYLLAMWALTYFGRPFG